MKKIIGIGVCLMAALVLIACPQEEEEGEAIVLKVGNAQQLTHPWNIALERMGAQLKGATDGQITMEIFPNSVLGTASEMIQNVKEGTLDMFVGDPTVGAVYAEELQLFALPFLFDNYAHWERVLDGPLGAEYSDLIAGKTGIRMVEYWGGSIRNTIAVEEPVRDIGDLDGFKLRLVPSELKVSVWSAVGASPVPVPFVETYSALAAGLVDGMENEYPSILSAKFYEVAPYFTKTEHEITVRPLFMNEEKLNSFTEEQRELFLEIADETTAFVRNLEAQGALDAIKVMTEQFGVTEYEIDKAPIKERTQAVFQNFGQQTGLADFIADVKSN